MRVDMVSIDSQFAEPFAQSIQALLANFSITAPDIMVSELVLDSRDVAVHKAFIAGNGHNRDGRVTRASKYARKLGDYFFF